MAEDFEDEKELDLDLDESAAGGGLKGGLRAKRKLILIIVLALAVLAGGGYAAYVMFFSGDGVEEESVDVEEEEVLGPPIYISLSPAFLIDFQSTGRQRFLQADLTVMTRNQEVADAVELHMPAVRNRFISIASAWSFENLQTTSGIEDLRELTRIELNKLMKAEIGIDEIDEVLFTSFVMQ